MSDAKGPKADFASGAGEQPLWTPAVWLGAQPGWRRGLIALAAGLISALALPPLYLFPLLLLSLPLLAWLLQAAPRLRTAAWTGWLFGLGHYGGGLYWIGESFLVDAGRTGFLMPFAVAGVAGGFAIFTTFFSGLFWQMTRCWGWHPLGVFAGLWLVFEWLRSWILTGFPWNLLGTVFAFSPSMMQPAAWGGVWLLSVLVIFFALAPYVAFRPGRASKIMALGLFLLPALIWGFGAVRLSGLGSVEDIQGPMLRLVQPNIAQVDKWNRDLRFGHVEQQILMSQNSAAPPPDLVIWSETAVPYILTDEPQVQSLLSRALLGQGHLVTGALRQGHGEEGRGLFNTLFVFNAVGQLVDSYDKTHLVPFGEYIPLRSFGLGALAAGQGDFNAGPARPLLQIGDLPPATPLICYEVIFPGALYPDSARGQWLLNITNDAWFGTSSGPHQHFAAARLRAVEEGLPLVRAANTGISAVVDPYGRLVGYLGLGVAGVLDAPLPTALAPTFFSQTRGLVVPILVFLLIGLSVWYRIRYVVLKH